MPGITFLNEMLNTGYKSRLTSLLLLSTTFKKTQANEAVEYLVRDDDTIRPFSTSELDSGEPVDFGIVKRYLGWEPEHELWLWETKPSMSKYEWIYIPETEQIQ